MKKLLAEPIVYLYALMIIMGFTVSNQLYQFRKELKTFRGSVVYDIDKVRGTLIEEMSFMFQTGCRWGTDYPPEFRESSTGFNQNSPVNYCGEQLRGRWEDYIYEQASKVGRK